MLATGGANRNKHSLVPARETQLGRGHRLSSDLRRLCCGGPTPNQKARVRCDAIAAWRQDDRLLLLVVARMSPQAAADTCRLLVAKCRPCLSTWCRQRKAGRKRRSQACLCSRATACARPITPGCAYANIVTWIPFPPAIRICSKRPAATTCAWAGRGLRRRSVMAHRWIARRCCWASRTSPAFLWR